MSPSINAYAARLDRLKRLYGVGVAQAADRVANKDIGTLDKIMLIVFGVVLIILYKILS